MTNDQVSKVAANLQAFRMGVAAHDRENPDHPPAYGIGMCHFDMVRLGFDEGETLWPGITVHTDEGGTGGFRVLCHAEPPEQPTVDALAHRPVDVA